MIPVRLQQRSRLSSESLAQVLRRIANPVKPFSFKFVQNDLPLALPDGIRDRLWKQPDLFDQLEESQAYQF